MSRYHRSASLLRFAGRWFHGTSAPEFSRFRPGEAYLTTDSDEAMGFAEGRHLGGSSGGKPRALEVSLAGGPIVDADEEVSLIIRDEHPELRDIDDLMARLREEGYRYADFTHPGFAGGDIRVRVSLHPEEDLDITPTHSASSESVPARTDKGLDVLINAVSGDMRGSVTVTDPATGKTLGTLDFEHVSDEWHRVTDTGVDEAYRRQGVATLMYNWVERTLGKSLLPSDDQSEDAIDFWTDRIGPYDPDPYADEEETTAAVRIAQSQEHEEYYTSEACAYFAIALHELYGYPLRILVDEGTEFQAGMPTVAHVYAMDRRVAVDAKGHRSQNEVMADFWDLVDPVVYDVTPSELANEWMGDDDDRPLYGPSESEVAEAKAIILAEPARYAPQFDDPPSDDATDAGPRANRTAGTDWQRTKMAVEEALRTRRVQGDDLLDALDLADELAGVNAEISSDGLVTLYHRTSQDTAEDIVRTGRMLSKEDRLFFGTHPTGQIEGYGSTAVRVRLPLEKLKLSDVFPSELHVTMMSGAIGTAVPVDAEIVGSGRESRAAYHALSRLAWSRDTLELGTMCGECGSDLDIAGRAGDPDDPLCRACHARQENPPAPPESSKSWWQWKATRTASALDHGPTFRDWQTKARHTIQDAFSGVEEDDESDWLAIAKSALAATLPHVMYRGFSVPATDAAEAERLGAAAIQSSRRSAPHSFSKAVARSFAVGVEPYWAAGGAISDAGMKHRDKLGQWGVIVSLSVGPNMVDWSCIHDGGGIFGEQVYNHLPFDKPVGEAIADMLIKSGGTHNAEWDLRVKSYPPKSANIEVFQIAPDDTSETEAMWRKRESEWETRDAARASAKSTDARRAASGVEAEIEAIAAEVRRRLGVDHELEDGEAPQALCLDFARGLAAELVRRGYSAGVTQGTFEVDCPDEDTYDEWDSDDFEGEEDEDEEGMSAEEVMEQATYFPLHYWVRVTAKGDEPIGPVFADITADQFDDECEESFDPVWVWTGETDRHQAQRHDFGGPVAGLRYHHAMQMLARSAGRKNRPLSGLYGTKIKKVVGGLRDRLLQFSVLLLHRLVEERRFAVILAEISVGADVHMTGSPEIEDPDDESKGKDIVRWSASKLERIKSRHRVRMSKTAGMDRELDVISEAFIRATSWLETAVPIYAVHMEYLDGISKEQDSPERKAEDRDESFLRKEFDPKIPGMKWDRKNLFAGRPEANSWSLRHMTNIYKHGPTTRDLKPMAMHRGNSGAAVLLDRRIDEMRSNSTAVWSLALSEDESGEYPTFLDAARNLLRACGSALTDDEKLLATEWEKIDDIARGGLSKSSAKKKGPRKPRKGPKKKRWDWSEFIGLKEKDPQERLERQIRKYKRDKGGRFTK